MRLCTYCTVLSSTYYSYYSLGRRKLRDKIVQFFRVSAGRRPQRPVRRPGQIDETANASDWELTSAEIDTIESLLAGREAGIGA